MVKSEVKILIIQKKNFILLGQILDGGKKKIIFKKVTKVQGFSRS